METDTSQLWTVLIYGFSGCGAGFMFLLGYMIKLHANQRDKIGRMELEDRIEKSFVIEIDKIVNSLNEIKGALLGSWNSQGLLDKAKHMEMDIEKIIKHQAEQDKHLLAIDDKLNRHDGT